MIRATIEHTLAELRFRTDLSVSERNTLRDCEIALGVTYAGASARRAAWNRCKRIILAGIRGEGQP